MSIKWRRVTCGTCSHSAWTTGEGWNINLRCFRCGIHEAAKELKRCECPFFMDMAWDGTYNTWKEFGKAGDGYED